MGNSLFISISILLSLSLSGCNIFDSKQSLSIEMVAFNSLTDVEKDLILVRPNDLTIEKVAVNDDIEPFIESDYDKDKLYSVTFNHTETDSSGNIVVFVDLDKITIVGKAFSIE